MSERLLVLSIGAVFLLAALMAVDGLLTGHVIGLLPAFLLFTGWLVRKEPLA